MSVAHVAQHYLAPFHRWLAVEGVTEFVINKPGECLIETHNGWQHHYDETLTYGRIDGIARSIANATNQQFGKENPILSATLTTGERVQFVGEPVTRLGSISVTVRKPGAALFSMEGYQEQGAFSELRPVDAAARSASSRVSDAERREQIKEGLSADSRELMSLLEQRELPGFLRHAVQSRKNIIVSGSTGSGKTTLMKSLIAEVGKDERLLSIENVDELELDRTFVNCVPMFYSAGSQSTVAIDQQTLLQSGLRMRPDRMFVAELIRGNEALSFMDTINSGHPGSITSVHTNSVQLAWSRLALLVKQSDTGQGLDYDVIRNLLAQTIDIIVQVNKTDRGRKVAEIFYDPVSTVMALEG